MRKVTLNRSLALVSAAGAALASVPAFATTTPPDYSALTGAVDFSTTQTAILSVGALAVGLALVTVGIRKILRMIKGA